VIKFGVVLVYGIMTLQAAGSIWEQPEEYENTLWQEMAIPILTGERGREIPDQGPPRAPVVHSEKEPMDLEAREGAKEPERVPAFAGTPYVSKNIIDSSDATAFVRLESRGRETWRGLAERFAVGAAFNSEPYIFDAFFTDGYRFELVVDGELGSEHEAGEVASDYASEFGRLPKSVRSGIKAGMILNNQESYYAYGKAGIIVMGHGFTQVLIKSGAWGKPCSTRACMSHLTKLLLNTQIGWRRKKPTGNLSPNMQERTPRQKISQRAVCCGTQFGIGQ
jgi:hypothetical protein